MRKALLGLALALWFAPAAAAAPGTARLLFQSDWSGTSEIYAADPSGRQPMVQVTFGRAPTCVQVGCGYTGAVLSPDGRLILYTDFSACSFSSTRPALFVARADGTHARVVAQSRSKDHCPRGLAGAWSPDSRRIAYPDEGRIHIVDANGRHNRVVGRGDRVSWSPDGTSLASLAFTPSNGRGVLSIRRTGGIRVVASDASDFTWSHNGRWLAYIMRDSSGEDHLDVVHSDGSRRRSLVSGAYLSNPRWSADNRFVSVGTTVVTAATGATRVLPYNTALAWTPRGHVLAVADDHGTYAVDTTNGAARQLTSDVAVGGIWSPDGRSFAYVWVSSFDYFGYSDLRIVTVSGSTRTLVRGGACTAVTSVRLHGCARRRVRATDVRSRERLPSSETTA
jgi:Tol biopolymer transport system component